MNLVLHGSFNCPCSFVASCRLDRLIDVGAAEVEGQALVHDSDVPVGGRPVTNELERHLIASSRKSVGCSVPTSRTRAGRPMVQPNTTLAAYAATASVGWQR
jgi:hypothetical protein